MAEEGGKASLQAAVIVAFTSILSGNQRQRKAAEDDLRVLEVTEGALTGTGRTGRGRGLRVLSSWCRLRIGADRDNGCLGYARTLPPGKSNGELGDIF